MSRPNKSADKIVDALVDLMVHKDYTAISISDISKAAHVSRICFYRNFTSKEQVLDRFIDRVVKDIQSQISQVSGSATLEDYFLILFHTVGRFSPIVREIYNSNLGSLMLHHFNDKLFTTPLEHLGVAFDTYQRRFYTGAFYNVLVEWIITGMHEPAEKLAAMCSHLTA